MLLTCGGMKQRKSKESKEIEEQRENKADSEHAVVKTGFFKLPILVFVINVKCANVLMDYLKGTGLEQKIATRF